MAVSMISAPLCLQNQGENDFYCSYLPVQISAATEVTGNFWNQGAPQYEGILGLGFDSGAF